MDDTSSSCDDPGTPKTDVDQHVTQTPPKKKIKARKFKVYYQKFRDSWKAEAQFAGWLSKSNRSTSKRDVAFCSICNSDITCGKSEIKRHANSERHKQLSRQVNKTKSVASYVIANDPIEKSARKIEFKVCAFLSEHHLPISLCEPLLDLLKVIFPSEMALMKVRLGKQRASNIIRQVFGKHFSSELFTFLRGRLFSVVIDETTDRSTRKQLCVLAQYFEDGKLESSFVDMIEVTDCSALGLYNALKECFISKEIPLENIVGFCSDTTNVMMGSNHSVSTLLKDSLPHVIIVKCSCHMIHLCASNACLKLPKFIEDLCRSIFAHFSLSSKRQHAYKEFQDFVDIEPHKILAPGQTRWLSLQACVKRLLEQWNALELYFTELAFTDPTQVNDMIVTALKDKFSRPYLEFLDYNLGKFNSYNTLFQSEAPNFFTLRTETCKLIRSLCSDFMDVSFVKNADISLLTPTHPMFSSTFVPTENIYLGVSASTSVSTMRISGAATKEELSQFQKSCQSFLIEAVLQIQKRFSLNDKIHDIVACINPRSASTLNPPSLAFLFDELPQLQQFADKKLVDEEWRLHYLDEELSKQLNFMQYWKIVLNRKNDAGLQCYPNLSVVITTLLSLPFSNAAVERFFSQLNITKTSLRSSLKNETLCGLMHGIYYMKRLNVSSYNLDFDDNMLKAMNNVKSDATCSEVAHM